MMGDLLGILTVLYVAVASVLLPSILIGEYLDHRDCRAANNVDECVMTWVPAQKGGE